MKIDFITFSVNPRCHPRLSASTEPSSRLTLIATLIYAEAKMLGLRCMRCPVCNNRETSVVDTRPAEDNFTVRRRRECDKCHYRFSTIEEIELLDIIVVKADGRRESYMRDKIENGIRRSLTKRPYTQENFHRLMHAVERDIHKKKNREIASKAIGELVMKHLRGFDKVAYIRFASVYRDFKDVKTFEKEVRKLK